MLQIQKRNGSLVSFNPSKILTRIRKAGRGLKVSTDELFIKVITSLPTEGSISTVKIDELISNTSAPYTGSHYDYSVFAASVAISSHNRATNDNIYDLYSGLVRQGVLSQLLVDKMVKYGVQDIMDAINFENDNLFDYFAWVALKTTYLLKNSDGIVVERPQFMYMRIAIWLSDSLDECLEIYNKLSNQLISYATPIMINSGTTNPQLASCVLIRNYEDSREGLLETFSDLCKYSSDAAGIGLCLSNIRSKYSKITTSGGDAGGLMKYLKIVNEGLRFFNQQGKRPGSAAIYIETWHRDIFDLLDAKKQAGKEEDRARDIFTALWVSDNFMRAVRENSDWYLFCPHEVQQAGLKPFYEIYGEEFEEEYNKAVLMGIGHKIKAMDLWLAIIQSQIETGVPYIAYKDNANMKSNHQMYGTITQSNLCCLSGDTIVDIVDNNGNQKKITMKQLNEEFKLGYKVLSEDGEYQDIITTMLSKTDAEVLEVIDETGNSLICTPDHKIYTLNRGYVRADELLEDDILDIVDQKVYYKF